MMTPGRWTLLLLACVAQPFLAVPPLSAQTAPAPLPAFDAASVRRFQVPPTGWAWGKPKMDPDHLSIPGAPLRDIILNAYGLDPYQLTGLPDWANREFYTVAASTAQPTPPDQMLLMLRHLLADRFGLQVESGSKPQPVWAIVAAPGGAKLRLLPAGQACANSISYQDMIAAGAPEHHAISSFNGCSLEDLVAAFNRSGNRQVLGRPVVDQTGITGHYALLVWQSYDSVEPVPGGRGRRMVGLETFREAVEKELGLRLVASTATLAYLHVLKLSPPTPQ